MTDETERGVGLRVDDRAPRVTVGVHPDRVPQRIGVVLEFPVSVLARIGVDEDKDCAFRRRRADVACPASAGFGAVHDANVGNGCCAGDRC